MPDDLADRTPAELYSARTAITLVSRFGACLGPIPAEVSMWLADVSTAINEEIERR
jgi:hypothetical protein